MPGWVLDSVLIHELAHLAVPNHGPNFQALVARYRLGERAKGYLIAKGEEAFNACLGLQVKKGQGPAYDYLVLHYRNSATLIAMGMPEVVVDGEVIVADPPKRLVQTYRFLFNDQMKSEGFTNVHNLEGGFKAWVKNGFESTKP
jgi:hypothetical protein